MGIETPYLGCRSSNFLCMSIDSRTVCGILGCNRNTCKGLIKWTLELTVLHKTEVV